MWSFPNSRFLDPTKTLKKCIPEDGEKSERQAKDSQAWRILELMENWQEKEKEGTSMPWCHLYCYLLGVWLTISCITSALSLHYFIIIKFEQFCLLCSQGLCGFECAPVCAHSCMCAGEGHVCMLREQRGTYNVCMWNLNCLCIKPCGFMTENTLILKRILNIKFVLNNWLQNQKSLEPLEIPNNYVSCGASLGSFIV